MSYREINDAINLNANSNNFPFFFIYLFTLLSRYCYVKSELANVF